MITARELAVELEAELRGAEAQWDRPLTALAPLDAAGSGSLTFLSSGKYRHQLPACGASAILLTAEAAAAAPSAAAALVVADPYLAYARASRHFSTAPVQPAGVHASAVVANDVVLGTDVGIAANAVVEAGCRLGDGCRVGPGCVLGEGVELGAGTCLMANVTLYHGVVLGRDCRVHAGTVIGSDGFGYAPAPSGWEKIAQLGRVVIGDRVEIGANCAIDRGAIGDTRIEDDVIIDNLVQVAHNVVLGRGTALAGQVGVAGSTEVGAGCTIGGQAGLAGHLRIADASHFTGQAMVTKGTREGGLYSSGLPLQPNRQWRRTVARVQRLDALEQRLRALEQALSSRPEEDPE